MDVDADRPAPGAQRRRPSPASSPNAPRGPWLPLLSTLYCADGVVGVITHIRGVARKPGGFHEPLYNLVMGPPLLAPGSLALVGGIGLAAAACSASADERMLDAARREDLRHPRRAPRPALGRCPATPRHDARRCGRYPGYDVLAQAEHWDEATRALVLGRVEDVPRDPLLRRRCRRPRSGVLRHRASRRTASRAFRCSPMIDAEASEGRLDGFRYADMPDDRETWRLVARGDSTRRRAPGPSPSAIGDRRAPGAFARAAEGAERVDPAFCERRVPGGAWDALPPGRAWKVVMRDVARSASTRTRGRGTRSASAAPPTRAATRASARRPAGAWESRGAVAVDPWPSVTRAARRLSGRAALARGALRPAGQRLGVPARRAPPRRSRPRADGALPRRRQVDLVDRRRRRRAARRSPSDSRGGLAGGGARGRPVLGPRRGLGLRRGGVARRSTGHEERIIGGSDPVELGKNNSGHGVGGSMVHYAGYCPALPSVGLRGSHPRRRRRRLADLLPGPEASLRAARARAAGRRRGLALGRPARLPAHAAPDRRRRRSWRGRARSEYGIEMRVGPVGIANGVVRQPPALHLPRLLPPGLQGQRQGLAAGHPHPRRDRPRRRDPRRLHGLAGRGRRRRPGASPASPTSHDGACALPARRTRSRRRLLDRDAAAAAQLDQRQVPERPRERHRPGRPLRDGPGRAAGGRPLPPEVQMYKAPPPEISSEQFYETDELAAGSRAGSRCRPSGRCRSAGPSTCSPRATGVSRCASTCATTTTGTRSARCASCCRRPRTGSPRSARCDRPSRASGRASMDYSLCDNDGEYRDGEADDAGHPGRRPARRRCSRSTATPIWSAVAAWGQTRSTACRLRPPRVAADQPVHRRRQRDADAGLGQPGADDHGARVAARRALHAERVSRREQGTCSHAARHGAAIPSPAAGD